MIQLLAKSTPMLVYVAGFATALVGMWGIYRQTGRLKEDSSRTQARAIIALTLFSVFGFIAVFSIKNPNLRIRKLSDRVTITSS